MRPGRAVAFSIADQGVAALTNIAVVVFAARQSSAGAFADFALVYAVFAVLLGACTAYVGQSLVLRGGAGRDPAELARDCRSAALFALAAATAVGLVLALPAYALSAGALAALGAVLPIVLTQDTLRYAFSVLRLPQLALAADLLRLAVAVPALALLPAGPGAATLVLAWGLSALPALGLASRLLYRATANAAGRPRPAALLARGHLGQRFVVEFGVGNASSQLAIIGLGALANPLAVGALRGAGTVFGPLNVLFNTATGFGPPLLGEQRSGAGKARTAALAGGALAAVAALWALLLSVLPDSWGRQLLGDTWQSASALIPATGSQYAAMAMGTCGLLALRVLSPRATLPIQLVFSLVSVVALLTGYALGGILGAAWGLCAGSAAKAVAAWTRVAFEVRVAAEREPEAQVPGGTEPTEEPGGRVAG
ncbi:hypothetical protein [Streptomyces sp. enrichment culture]|uniref:hypothetical protein n=1 Tax=Streptomyces sp. enrichment culture TaxID=1795815 RepID=UPI003F55211C